MCRKDNGVFPAEHFDKIAYLDDLARVKSYGRFVEYKHFGVADKRLSDTHALAVAF